MKVYAPILFLIAVGCASSAVKMGAQRSPASASRASDDLDVLVVGECIEGKIKTATDWGVVALGPLAGPFADPSSKYSTFKVSYITCEATSSGRKKKFNSKYFDVGFFEDNDSFEVTDDLKKECESFRADLKMREIANKECR